MRQGARDHRRWRCAACLLALLLAACGGRSADSSLRVEITHLAAGEPLRLNGGSYPTRAGDAFSVTQLRYYLSNFRLHRADGSWYTAPRDARTSVGYYLIDESDAASKSFTVEAVPDGEYDGIEFLVGVDAARNHAGAQNGTLDPARGLFWTWKSGYIFFLLEGTSPQSPADDHGLKFHIGGDEPSTARTLYLPIAPKPARIDARLSTTVHLQADIASLFDGDDPIRFAQLHAAMGGAPAVRLADHLPAVFRVDHVHHEPHRK